MGRKGLCVLSDARPPWQKNLLRSFKARPCAWSLLLILSRTQMIKTLLEMLQKDFINSLFSLIPAWIITKKAKKLQWGVKYQVRRAQQRTQSPLLTILFNIFSDFLISFFDTSTLLNWVPLIGVTFQMVVYSVFVQCSLLTEKMFDSSAQCPVTFFVPRPLHSAQCAFSIKP